MTLYLGVLSDSYRRQLRQLRDRPAIDVVLEKVIPIAREFDIQPLGIDFGVGQLASTEASYLDEFKGRLAKHNLLPTVIVGTLMLHADNTVSEPALQRTIQNLQVAKDLGSHLGLFYFGYGGRVTREGRIRIASEQIQRLADAAADLDLTVTTENYDFFTSDDFLEIFERVGRDNVGLHNDTGNWLILNEDPLAATRKMAPYTYHAHVRDYVMKEGVHSSVPIGQGAVDFPPILEELRRIAESKERFIMAMEMDLDDGDAADEDASVRACARYMVDWYRTL